MKEQSTRPPDRCPVHPNAGITNTQTDQINPHTKMVQHRCGVRGCNTGLGWMAQTYEIGTVYGTGECEDRDVLSSHQEGPVPRLHPPDNRAHLPFSPHPVHHRIRPDHQPACPQALGTPIHSNGHCNHGRQHSKQVPAQAPAQYPTRPTPNRRVDRLSSQNIAPTPAVASTFPYTKLHSRPKPQI